jgi:hypothetical protein
MRKGFLIAVVIIVGMAAIGVIIALNVLPRYSILQKTRSIQFSAGPADFTMSPAKVKVFLPRKGQSITIPVSVWNGPGETVFTVNEQEPTKFDNGYFAPSGDSGYKFTFSKTSLDLQGNTTGTFEVTVQRTASTVQKNIEYGLAVNQTTDGQGISMVRTYILEIEN